MPDTMEDLEVLAWVWGQQERLHKQALARLRQSIQGAPVAALVQIVKRKVRWCAPLAAQELKRRILNSRGI
jgi:hypothetical protein